MTLRGHERLAVIACVLTATLVCAAPALAQPDGWAAPVTLDSAGGHPQVAVDPAGDATATWVDSNSDGWSNTIVAASRPAGGSWSTPSDLETIGDSAGAQIAMDSAGDAIAAWTGDTGSPGNWTPVIRAAWRPAGGPWSTPVTLDTGSDEGTAAVAVDPSGEATVGWVVQDDNGDGATDTNSLRVATRSTDGTWSSPTTLETAANLNNIPTPSIAMDALGDTTVGWSASPDPTATPYVDNARIAFRPAGGAWSTPTTIDTNLSYMAPVHVAMDALGDTTAAWTTSEASGAEDVRVASRPAAGPWSTPTTLDTDAADPALIEDDAGEATAVWDAARYSGTWSIRTASQPAGGTWSAPATLDTGAASTSLGETPSVTGDAAGDAMASWGTDSGDLYVPSVRVSSRSPDGTWSSADTLDDDGSGASIGLDQTGDATALWQHDDYADDDYRLVASTHTALPAVAITGGPTGLVNSSDATFAFDSGQAGTHYQCQLDGAAWADCTSPQSYSGLADGSHTFQVRSYDPATQTGGTPDSQTWTVDTTPPQTTITSGPSGSTTATSVQFGFTSSEANSTFACTIDGGLAVPCSSPQPYDGLAPGSHTFTVTATDAADNPDPSPASRTFTVVAPSNPGAGGGGGSGAGGGGGGNTAPSSGGGSGDGGFCPVDLYRAGTRSHGATAQAAGVCGSTDKAAPPADCPDRQYADRGFGAFVVIAVKAAGCFKPRHGLYVSTGPVRVNGMLVTLPHGGQITLDYTHHVLATTTAPDISLAGWMDDHPFHAPGPMHWTSYKPTFVLGLPFGHDLPLELGGLQVSIPKLELDSDNAGFGAGTGGATRLSLDVGVPHLFGEPPVPDHGGEPEDDEGEPALEVTAETSNGNGFQWIGKFETGPLQFGAFQVKDLSAEFDTTRQVFDGSGTVVLPGPPGVGGPEVSMTLGFGLDDSGRRLAVRDFSLAADNLNKPILETGFFLQRLHVALGYNTNLTPVGRVSNYTLGGGGGGTFGPQISKTSSLYKVFHTQAFISLDGDLTFGFPTAANTWYMIAGGTGRLLNMQMADGGVEVQGTGAIDIWGSFTLGLNGWGASFEVPRGQGWYSHGNVMQLHGYGHVGLPGLAELNGEVLANQLGVVACRTTDWRGNSLPVGQRTGFNYTWGGAIGTVDGSCDLGPLNRKRPAARSAATGQQVSVPPHTHLVDLAVTGQGAAPKVSVTGPHGETVGTPADGSGVDTAQFTLFQDPQTDTTHVVVRNPAAGAWTVTPQPGSAPVTDVGRALGLPVPKVTGRVACRRGRCALRYRLRPIAGQRVVLSEVGAGATRTIGTVARRAGTVRFTPQPGVAGTRKVIATVTQGGLPRAQIVVARFHVRSGRPAAPRRVRARRAGHRLIVSWARVPGATGYTVSVRGARQTVSAFTHAARASLAAPAGRRLRVTVTPVNTLGSGRAAHQVLRRPAPRHRSHR